MSKKIIRTDNRENDSLYRPGVTMDEFLEKKKMFSLDPSVAKEQLYDVTDGKMKVVNVIESPELVSSSLYFMNKTAMCYPGMLDSINKEHVDLDHLPLVTTTISSVGYVCKFRLYYLILNAMHAAKVDLLKGALDIPYVYSETNSIAVSADEKNRYDKAYETFSRDVNGVFNHTTRSLCGYLLESISIENLTDDDIIIFNCITEAVSALSGSFYDYASKLLSDSFVDMFGPYECFASDTLITLHNNLICAAKQFLDELNNSGNRRCVLAVDPLNSVLSYPTLADSFADSNEIYNFVARGRKSEEV